MGSESLEWKDRAVFSEQITINYFDGQNYSDARYRTIRRRRYLL